MIKRNWKNSLIVFSVLFSLILIFYQFTPKANSQTDHVVISEVQIEGSSSTDEFVELYNPLSVDVDLTGWRLTRSTSSGNEHNLDSSLSGTIPAHGYYLIAHPDYDGTVAADEDYSAASQNIAPNNSVSLYSDAGVTIVDIVGTGTTTVNETTATVVPGTDESIERKAHTGSTYESMSSGGDDELLGNGHDSNDNSMDFILRTDPEPQNTSTTEDPTLPSPTPTQEPSSTPTPSTEPTNTPTPTVEVTITPSPTATVTATPIPTVTGEVTPTATLEPSPTETEPTPTAEPTPTPEPTPTEFTRTIGTFAFPDRTKVCELRYRPVSFGFFTFYLPSLNCFDL